MARRSRVVESSSDSEGDHASSEAESDDSPRNQLIDMEAVESDESSEESSTLGDDDDKNLQSRSKPVFTKFKELPPELRRHIWELFCPDLVSQARVLNFDMIWHALSDNDFNAHWRFQDGMSLGDQTEALRKVSAVHQESRQLVLNHYPDTLFLQAGSGDAEVRFHKDRDIVFFNNLTYSEPLYNHYDDGFCNQVRHAAFPLERNAAEVEYEKIKYFIRAMPNLKTVFISKSHEQIGNSHVQWCGSRMMRYARVETFEKRPGYGENLEWVYCWPDPQKRWHEITRLVLDNFPSRVPSVLSEALETLDVKLAPMICFEFEIGQTMLSRLVQKHDFGRKTLLSDDEFESGSSESGEEVEEPNEYESDGIDDAEILSQYSSSEDELVPDPISPGGSPDPGNFSPAEEDETVARFSSPELDASDDEDGDMERPTRAPKRRIVSDSEEEDDEPRAKRARTQPVVVDDSSDSDEGPRKKGIRTQLVVVDGSSDDEDEGPRGASQRSRAGRVAQVISSDSESGDEEEDAKSNSEGDNSQSDSEDEEDDDRPPARLSLAERLKLHRQNNPVGSSDDDGSQEGSEEENSFIHDEDEDEDEEDDESRDGLLDDMAEQSDGEGEGESEDGW